MVNRKFNADQPTLGIPYLNLPQAFDAELTLRGLKTLYVKTGGKVIMLSAPVSFSLLSAQPLDTQAINTAENAICAEYSGTTDSGAKGPGNMVTIDPTPDPYTATATIYPASEHSE